MGGSVMNVERNYYLGQIRLLQTNFLALILDQIYQVAVLRILENRLTRIVHIFDADECVHIYIILQCLTEHSVRQIGN